MEILQRREDGVVVLELTGPFQQDSEEDLQRTLDDLIQRNYVYAVLNLSGISSITSHALSVMISGKKRLQKAQGDMVLSELRPVIRELFEFTRLQTVFDLFDADGAAIAFFNRSQKRK